VPLFVCDAVFEAIVRAGHRPVFLDVDPETMVLSASSYLRDRSIDALVAVHIFGNPVDVQPLMSDRPLPVIEDCAHALFSEIRGTPVGLLGVGSIYSFGLGKPISIGQLGAAVVPPGTFADAFWSTVGQMRQESRVASVYRGFRSFAISTLYRRPWYGMFSYELGRQFERSLDPMSHEVGAYEISPARLMSLVRSKMHTYRAALPRQREGWRALSDAVKDGSSDNLVPQATPKGAVSDNWLFAVRCASIVQRDALADLLLRRGVDSVKMYDQVPKIARSVYGYLGGAPDAERLCQTVLALSVPARGAASDRSFPDLVYESVRALR
jgi:dTDP-4-amino-4,6-dideoxygalactose transaminase